MKCPNCYKEIEDHSLYCEYCGSKVKKAKWPWLVVIGVIAAGIICVLNYSNSSMRNEELAKEETYFRNCESASDYRHYVRMYPNGQFVSLANNKINQFVNDSLNELNNKLAAEDIAYSNCINANSCRYYLRQYPTGRYVNLIRQKLDDYVADSIVEQDYMDSYSMREYYYGIDEEESWEQEEGYGFEEEFEDQEIFQIVEEMPVFPGGEAKLIEYVANNVRYPQTARELGIQGRVYVGFVVEPDGSVSNVSVIRSIGGGCDEEAVRVVKNMPKWKPGKQHGKAVRVSYMLPLNFKLNNQ